jgi:hypothetical protein
MRPHRFARVLLLAALMVSTGCDSKSPTSPTTTPTSPVTETWTGIVGAAGTASRSFTSNQSGTITVTLTTSGVPLGIGLGVPRTANGGCRLTVSQVVTAGGTVSTTADAGNYCVQLYDDGAVVSQAAFIVTIVYP